MHRSLIPLTATLLAALPALASAGFWVLPEDATDGTTTVTPRATSCAAPVVPQSTHGETEPNGEQSTADPLTTGVTMLGQNYGAGDTDWYYFQTTTVNEVFSASFTVAGLSGEETGTWRIKLEDVSGNTIAQREAALTETAYVEAIMATLANPGYYFLAVSVVEHSDKNYSLLTSQRASGQPDALPPPAAVVFRRDSRRMRLPVVEVHDLDGSVDYYDATLEHTGGSTFELTDAVPIN